MVPIVVHMVQIDELTAAAVRDAKRSAGATNEELSEATGIPLTTLKRQINGHRSFRLDHLMLVANALKVPIEALIPTSATLNEWAA